MSAAGLAVLIVDDFPDTADSLGRVLQAHAYDVRTARRRAEALNHLIGWQPQVAVLDVMMPDMDGLELAERLYEQCGRRPLLVAVSGTLGPLRSCCPGTHTGLSNSTLGDG
jgi:CheY-like chemotaxis protein